MVIEHACSDICMHFYIQMSNYLQKGEMI
jgi:hypothetical protein